MVVGGLFLCLSCLTLFTKNNLSVLFDIVYKNKIRGNSLSTFLKLNFISPVVLIYTRSEVFTNSISDSDYWEIFFIYMYTGIVKSL